MTYEDYYQALSASDFATTALCTICDPIKTVQSQRTFLEQLNRVNEIMAQQEMLRVPTWTIIRTTRHYQNRSHHKTRINKKWAKRYGVTSVEVQDKDVIICDHKIYVTDKGFKHIQEAINHD